MRTGGFPFRHDGYYPQSSYPAIRVIHWSWSPLGSEKNVEIKQIAIFFRVISKKQIVSVYIYILIYLYTDIYIYTHMFIP